MLFMPCDGGSVDVSELWLGEAQFERLRPLLPDKVRGVAQVDAPACYGSRKTLDNQFARWAAKGIWQEMIVTLAAAGGPPAGPDRQHAYESSSLGKRRKRRALVRTIGISRGGRNSKLHAPTDGNGRPLRCC